MTTRDGDADGRPSEWPDRLPVGGGGPGCLCRLSAGETRNESGMLRNGRRRARSGYANKLILRKQSGRAAGRTAECARAANPSRARREVARAPVASIKFRAH